MNQKLRLCVCILFLLNIQIQSVHSWRANLKLLDYGQPCNLYPTENDGICNLEKNLECSSSTFPNVCACKLSTEYNQTEYDGEVRACLHVPGVADSFSCQTHTQCASSSYGSFSRCNQEGRCECFHEKEETQLVDNICFLARPIPYGGKSVPMSPCNQNYECTSSALGQLSRCNMASRTCECFDTVTNGKRPTAPYNGKCVAAKRLEDFCEHDYECQAGYHVNAICSVHDNYLSIKEKVCVCPQHLKCDGGSSATTTTVKLGFISLCLLSVGIFHCQ